MSPIITYTLLVAIGSYGLIIVVELLIFRGVKRFVIQTLILFGVAFLLNVTTGFPATKQAFGGASPVLAIGIMFVCTLLGIGAHYFFYLREKFSWRSFVKPLVISPIVLLPLMGSVQGTSNVESIQLISFGFLAFQNGFFWKEVLERARPYV